MSNHTIWNYGLEEMEATRVTKAETEKEGEEGEESNTRTSISNREML